MDWIKMPKPSSKSRGFTLLELLVLLVMVAISAFIAAPGFTRVKSNGKAVQCLDNHRHLALAWQMYAHDDLDQAINNFSVSGTMQTISIGQFLNWANNIMDWSTNDQWGNFNPTNLQTGLFAPYTAGKVGLYKCPADNYLSAAQLAAGHIARTRSVSMNGFFGPYDTLGPSTWETGRNTFFSSYRQWLKVSRVAQPGNTFVFLDEHPDSMNDGYFLNNPVSAAYWGDIPASLHNGGAVVTFADGHSELHIWLSSRTKIPVQFSYFSPAFDSAGRVDYQWLITRSAAQYQ